MHDDRADVARIAQAHVLPREPRIDGLIKAVAVRDVAAGAGFAGADVDNVVIRIGNRDCADG